MQFRLKSAHYFPNDMYLPGDRETGDNGTVVGDGTRYPVVKFSERKPGDMTPTIEMEPLDEDAEAALEEERERLASVDGGVLLMEQLAQQLQTMQVSDPHDAKYIPGFGNTRRGKQ